MNEGRPVSAGRCRTASLAAIGTLLALSGCAAMAEQRQRAQQQQVEQMRATCDSYGAGLGTPGYTDCMLRLRAEQDANSTAASAQWQANWRAQQQMQQDNSNATLRAMTPAPYVPQTRTTTCMPMGNMVSCSSY